MTVDDGDCDDNDPWAGPGVVEMCDGIDNDCDGVVDEDCMSEGVTTEEKGECGCGGIPGAAAVFPVLLAGLAVTRRRRVAA